MDNKIFLSVVENLTFVKTKEQLEHWIESFLIPAYSPSSVLIAVCKLQPELTMTPYYVTPLFPKSLIRAFNLNYPNLTIPLLDECRKANYPVVTHLAEEHLQDILWRTMFYNNGFSVAFATVMEPHSNYFTYLCITDPKINNLLVPEQCFIKALSILMPLLNFSLSKLESDAVRNSKNIEINKLTQREREILGWIIDGKTNWEIASILGLAFPTVKNYVQKILIKLQLTSRTQAIYLYGALHEKNHPQAAQSSELYQ